MREYKSGQDIFTYTGRFDFSNPRGALCAWSGSSVGFCLKASSLVVEIENFSPVSLGFENNYFVVAVNGVKAGILKLKNAERYYNLSQYVNPDEFVEIRLFKNTEAICGKVRFCGMETDNEAKVVPVDRKKRLFIEFIGDSVTCGKDILGPVCDGSFDPALESAWDSWASVGARQLDADWSMVSFSGKGMWRNHDLSSEFTIPVLYDRIIPQSTGKWDLTSQRPDVVALNLGTNDFLYRVAFPEVFSKTYADFVFRLMELYPDALFVCCMGPMLSDNGIVNGGTGKCSPGAAVNLRECIGRVIEMLGNPSNVQFCQLSAVGGLDPEPSDHPGVNLQALNGREFAEFVTSHLKQRSMC